MIIRGTMEDLIRLLEMERINQEVEEDCSEHISTDELEEKLKNNTYIDDFNHYYKDVRHLNFIDIYSLGKLWDVRDSTGAKMHAIKKILNAGERGNKSEAQDIKEAIVSLQRYLEILEE